MSCYHNLIGRHFSWMRHRLIIRLCSYWPDNPWWYRSWWFAPTNRLLGRLACPSLIWMDWRERRHMREMIGKIEQDLDDTERLIADTERRYGIKEKQHATRHKHYQRTARPRRDHQGADRRGHRKVHVHGP